VFGVDYSRLSFVGGVCFRWLIGIERNVSKPLKKGVGAIRISYRVRLYGRDKKHIGRLKHLVFAPLFIDRIFLYPFDEPVRADRNFPPVALI